MFRVDDTTLDFGSERFAYTRRSLESVVFLNRAFRVHETSGYGTGMTRKYKHSAKKLVMHPGKSPGANKNNVLLDKIKI